MFNFASQNQQAMKEASFFHLFFLRHNNTGSQVLMYRTRPSPLVSLTQLQLNLRRSVKASPTVSSALTISQAEGKTGIVSRYFFLVAAQQHLGYREFRVEKCNPSTICFIKHSQVALLAPSRV